jgi:hypothetical protein
MPPRKKKSEEEETVKVDSESIDAQKRADTRLAEKKAKAEEEEIAKAIPIDSFAEEAFRAIGIDNPSGTLRAVYNDFKKRKDQLQPGRLKPYGFVFCVQLAEIVDAIKSIKED